MNNPYHTPFLYLKSALNKCCYCIYSHIYNLFNLSTSIEEGILPSARVSMLVESIILTSLKVSTLVESIILIFLKVSTLVESIILPSLRVSTGLERYKSIKIYANNCFTLRIY